MRDAEKHFDCSRRVLQPESGVKKRLNGCERLAFWNRRHRRGVDDDHVLADRLASHRSLESLVGAPAPDLFVQLCELSGDDDSSLSPGGGGEISQRHDESLW